MIIVSSLSTTSMVKIFAKCGRAVQALKERARFPCLEAALRDPRVSRTAKRDITEILYNACWPEAAPVLIEQLRSEDPDVRANAAEALGAIERCVGWSSALGVA